MMNKKNIIIAAIAVVLVGGGVFALVRAFSAPKPVVVGVGAFLSLTIKVKEKAGVHIIAE